MKSNWKIIVICLLIGGFFGSALTLGAMCYRRDHGGSKPWMSGKYGGGMRQHMYKKLKLTPEQKTKVDTILKTSREKLDKLFSATRPQIDAVRAETRAQIRQILNPEQQATYDKWEAKREARRKERRERAKQPD